MLPGVSDCTMLYQYGCSILAAHFAQGWEARNQTVKNLVPACAGRNKPCRLSKRQDQHRSCIQTRLRMAHQQVRRHYARPINVPAKAPAGPPIMAPVAAPPPTTAPYSIPSRFSRESGLITPSAPTCVRETGVSVTMACNLKLEPSGMVTVSGRSSNVPCPPGWPLDASATLPLISAPAGISTGPLAARRTPPGCGMAVPARSSRWRGFPSTPRGSSSPRPVCGGKRPWMHHIAIRIGCVGTLVSIGDPALGRAALPAQFRHPFPHLPVDWRYNPQSRPVLAVLPAGPGPQRAPAPERPPVHRQADPQGASPAVRRWW